MCRIAILVVLFIGLICSVFMEILTYKTGEVATQAPQEIEIVVKTNVNKSLPKPEIEVITQMIENIIELEEGFRAVPYLCSEGYVTVGYGTKLHTQKGMNPDDFPIRVTPDIARSFLREEVSRLVFRLTLSSVSGAFNKLSTERKAIIVSMAYQLGIYGVLKFKKMWAAIDGNNFVWAANEMMDSKWAIQTNARALRHSRAMLNNSLEMYVK